MLAVTDVVVAVMTGVPLPLPPLLLVFVSLPVVVGGDAIDVGTVARSPATSVLSSDGVVDAVAVVRKRVEFCLRYCGE